MNRRFFLEGLGVLSLSSLLTSCNSASTPKLRVYLVRRSLPIQLLKNAKRSLSPKIPVSISVKSNVAELFGLLQKWQVEENKEAMSARKAKPQKQTSSRGHDLKLVALGDYWLSQAIRSQLIAPLDLSPSVFDVIPEAQRSRWKSLVQRDDQGNPSATGKIWGAPYRWGATVLVYRKDKLKQLGWELTDWSDLWRPELKQKVGLLNHPREVIGMTLKTLGQSYNETRPNQQAELAEKLRSLAQQVRTYSSKNYIQPLILGDTWVTMGWTSDILPALAQDDKLGVIFPLSGSAIWADIWVKSQSLEAPNTDEFPEQKLLSQWVSYWWSKGVAHDISSFTDASSIIPTSSDPQSERFSHTGLTAENFARSEFLLPLNAGALEQYQALWQTMRSTLPEAS